MTVVDHPLLGLGYAKPIVVRPLLRLTDAGAAPADADVAEEVPIALVYNGRPHVVVMASPLDLEDLAVGFTRTEGIVDDVGEIERVDVVRASHGVELQIQIPDDRAELLRSRSRGLVARTACGLCGIETIGEMLRVPRSVETMLRIDTQALWRAGAALGEQQAMNRATKSVHAAAWARPDGTLVLVREDVGRHNALDKVLGALARDAAGVRGGFIVVTSRASYELIQKAATCGVELLAAISRPTGLAIRFAEAAGMTLVGLLRGKTANVYCGPRRIVH
jgi:FdhD protein